ncbi:peptidylprolyl isomerase [bacterium]|nr:peptidylprolyl isomerase [bacterium]
MKQLVFMIALFLLACGNNVGNEHLLYTNRGKMTTVETFRQEYRDWRVMMQLSDSREMRKKFLYERLLNSLLYSRGSHEGVELLPEISAQVKEFQKRLIIKHMSEKLHKEVFSFTEESEWKYYETHSDEFTRKRLFRLFALRIHNAQTAKRLAKEVKQGGDIRLLSSRYNDDRMLAMNNGDWGLFSNDVMDPLWRETVANGSLGEVFGPLKDSDGYWVVIQIFGYAYKRKLSFERVRPIIIKKMMKKEGYQKWQTHVRELLTQSGIRVNEEYLNWE